LSEIKDLNELTLIENKNKNYFLLILLIKIINKEGKQIINSKKTFLIFCKMIIEPKEEYLFKRSLFHKYLNNK
jgi:hypothetical protein